MAPASSHCSIKSSWWTDGLFRPCLSSMARSLPLSRSPMISAIPFLLFDLVNLRALMESESWAQALTTLGCWDRYFRTIDCSVLSDINLE